LPKNSQLRPSKDAIEKRNSLAFGAKIEIDACLALRADTTSARAHSSQRRKERDGYSHSQADSRGPVAPKLVN